MVTNPIVTRHDLKNLGYEKVPENTQHSTSYKRRSSYRKYALLYRTAEISLETCKLLSLLISFTTQVGPRPLQPSVSSACPGCTMGHKLHCYPALLLASQLHTPYNSSLQIKVTANKTKHPFCMNANGWQMRKSSYNSHIHHEWNFIGVTCQQ